MIIAHKGTDLITYDSSLDTNQSVNIDTKTLTINVGNSTIHTYDTTVDKSVDIDFYTSGTNIGITDGVGNNRAVNLSIEETLVTSGNDINMANATYGGTSGDIVNVKSILMDANAGEIGSTSNLVNNIHAARIYVAQIGAVGAYNDNIYSDHTYSISLVRLGVRHPRP